MNKLVIITIIYVVFLFTLRKYYFSKQLFSNNYGRHKHSDVKYAHFSKIDKINYFLYPKLLLASPQKYILKAGDALMIPKKWWHWIKTTEQSYSINFWFDNDIFNKPNKIKYTNKINFEKLKYIIVGVWNTLDDSKNYHTTLNTFLNLKKKYEYVITLDDYLLSSYNYNLKKIIQNQIKLPNIVRNYTGTYNYNLWITSSYTDTGLHYDDNDGILCCLSGTKEIFLYPPSDTKYLYKFETYDWINNKSINFRYNSFEYINDINGLSSSRLLYESCIHSYKILNMITNIVKENGINKTIWKCENKNGELRWEFFKYDKNNYKFIESYKVFDKKPYINNKKYFHYNKNNIFILPLWGYTKYQLNSQEYLKCKIFVIDTFKNISDNYYKYMNKLDYNYIADKFKKIILNTYDCHEIGIYNKSNNIIIKYLGITKEKFIEFLKINNYNKLLIFQYEKYDFNINNEIMIEYNINTLSIIKTGFYGIV